MDYSTLSDHQINCRVAEAQGKSVLKGPNGAYRGSPNAVLCFCDHWYDYCNKPADAWPIIVENVINMSWFTDGERVLASNTHDDIIHQSTNPLRAAMVVYLMMNEQ